MACPYGRGMKEKLQSGVPALFSLIPPFEARVIDSATAAAAPKATAFLTPPSGLANVKPAGTAVGRLYTFIRQRT